MGTSVGLDAPPGRSSPGARIPGTRWLLCLLLIATPFSAGRSQVPQYNGGLSGVERDSSGFPGLPPNANPRPDGVRALRDAMHLHDQQKRTRELMILRQKEMTTDTQRLLALAQSLKVRADESGAVALSMNEVREAEQIEKLAKTVSQKMKSTIGEE